MENYKKYLPESGRTRGLSHFFPPKLSASWKGGPHLNLAMLNPLPCTSNPGTTKRNTVLPAVQVAEVTRTDSKRYFYDVGCLALCYHTLNYCQCHFFSAIKCSYISWDWLVLLSMLLSFAGECRIICNEGLFSLLLRQFHSRYIAWVFFTCVI